MDVVRRLRFAVLLLGLVIVAGTVGYVLLGFSWLDALYQTITTITTVGFRELRPLSAVGKVFTIVLILVGVGTIFGLLLEALVEGQIQHVFRRRRVQRDIEKLRGHVIICGWGRVGRAIAHYLAAAGEQVVVVDQDAERVASVPFPSLTGDCTDDATLQRVGVARARVLVAALAADADNVFVTLSSRALRRDLVIIARARNDASESKLLRAGANRVVNPQRIGGERMAAFARQPNVVEFLDVVMHEGNLEFRLEEIDVPRHSPLAGSTLREAGLRDRTGALILAVRAHDGSFMTNPPDDTAIEAGTVMIAMGTEDQLAGLQAIATGSRLPTR